MRECGPQGLSVRVRAFTPFLLAIMLAAALALPAAGAEKRDPVSDALAALRAQGPDAGEADTSAANPSEAGVAEPDAMEPAPEPQASAGASATASKLQVHGFMTQAYAESSFTEGGLAPAAPGADEIVLGIPEDGTTDYRTMAIQFRYEITPKDIAVIQLSHRRLGTSPIRALEDEVDVDWAFYERRLGDSSYFKVGRIQIPLGIFNEIRDVGTVLPFYRPPYQFYREGSFTTETVDGVLFGHTFWSNSSTNLDVDIYYGGWDVLEFTPPGSITGTVDAAISRAEDGGGIQLWLNTALPGLRFGLAGQRSNRQGGLFQRPGEKTNSESLAASIDAVFSKFVFRAEFIEFDFTAAQGPASNDVEAPVWYVQLGFHATEKWRFYVQREQGGTSVVSQGRELFDIDVWDGLGFAINYAFNPNLVFKAEWHEFDIEEITFRPFPPPPGFVSQTAQDGSHFILSISASF